MAQVEQRHLLGKSNCAIALELGVSEATVRSDLARCDELYRERVGADVEQSRAVAIRRLEGVIGLARESYEWDKAREDAVLFGDTVGTGGDGKPRRVLRDDKGSAQFRSNKAAALSVIEKAAMDIAKLQGLVVDKVSPTNPDGTALDLASLILKVRADGS
jgi:hypothetical protein